MDLQIPTKRIASEEASKRSKKQRRTKEWTPSDGEGTSLDATTWLLYDPSEIPIITPDDYRDSSGTKGLPGYVILGDRTLSTVIMTGVGREERGKLWPLDFTDGRDMRPDRVRVCEAAMGDVKRIYEVRAADGTKILLKGKLRLDRATIFPTRRLVLTSRPPTRVQPLTAISVHNAVHPMSPSGMRPAEPLHVTTSCIIESCPSTTQLKEGQPSVEQQLPTSRFTTSGKSPLASQADVEEMPSTSGKSLLPPTSEKSLLSAAREERPARGHSVQYYKRQLKAKPQLTEEERSFQSAAKLMQAMLFRTCQVLDRAIDEGRRVANNQSNFIASLEYLSKERADSDENIFGLLVDVRNIHGESPADNARIELRRCKGWLRYELPESMKALPAGRHNLLFPRH